MTDTSAHETIEAIRALKTMGFTEEDLAKVCFIPDCGCDGEPHP